MVTYSFIHPTFANQLFLQESNLFSKNTIYPRSLATYMVQVTHPSTALKLTLYKLEHHIKAGFFAASLSSTPNFLELHLKVALEEPFSSN